MAAWPEYYSDFFSVLQVHGRIAQRHSLVQRFDDQLKEVGRQLCMRFGREEFSCDFLGHSADYLVKVSALDLDLMCNDCK